MALLTMAFLVQLPRGSKKTMLIIFTLFKISCRWTIWLGRDSISFFKQVVLCRVTVDMQLLVVPVVLSDYTIHFPILVPGMEPGELVQEMKQQMVNGRAPMDGSIVTVPGGQMQSMV